MPRKIYRFTPEADEAGMRLDQFVPARTDELSRTLLRKVVDLGGAHIDGRRVRRCSQPVVPGAAVEIHIDGLPMEPYRVDEREIVLQDPYLLALSKPAGVDAQPTPSRYKGTLYEALLTYLRDPCRPKQRPELGMVQRLDRETSGIVVFSIHKRAHRPLTEIISGRVARKTYLAIAGGRFDAAQGEIRSLLARNRASNLVRSVARGGKEAITRYRVLEEYDGASLVEVDLVTGRSHQIRAHFAEAGCPLLGDERYGGSPAWQGLTVPRQMLHSLRLQLPHPVTGEPLSLEAAVPPDMQSLLQALRG